MDDGWIALEIKERKMRAVEMEREKKKRLGNHARRKGVLPILNCLEHKLNSNVGRLKDSNLKVLLKRKGIPTLNMGNMAAKKVLYKKNVEEGGGGKEDKASITARGLDNDNAALDTLKYAAMEMGNTTYGRFETKKKKDIKQVYKKMTAEEKNDLMRKLAKLNPEGANGNESAPPSLTPV